MRFRSGFSARGKSGLPGSARDIRRLRRVSVSIRAVAREEGIESDAENAPPWSDRPFPTLPYLAQQPLGERTSEGPRTTFIQQHKRDQRGGTE